jgi:formate/nitrite transporter FocA (FNT family)
MHWPDPMASRQTRRTRDDERDDGARRKAGVTERSAANSGVTEREIEDVEERTVPRTPVIYEIVRRLGEEEMARPANSLWWSGVAAGLSISFSLLAQAILRAHLPDEAWRPLVTSFGYSIGFVMVVLSRQQLFTENTVTVVLPVMADFTAKNLRGLARMWTIVFLANMAGTLVAALFCTFTPVLPAELRDGMIAISGQVLEHSWLATAFMAVGAGFLMAAMVWLLPGAEGAQFHVVVVMTWLIAAGGFTHVVAGSMEAFMLALNGGLGFWAMLGYFFVPVLIGNIVGGTALFALLAYAQVMQEI